MSAATALRKASLTMVVAAIAASGIVAAAPRAHAQADAANPPPSVINMSTIPSQYSAAVQAFETNAVDEVLTDHDLPSSDYDAVLAWGRDDVRAQEWSDLDQIISEPESQRSANDELVYQWFQSVEQQQQIAAAQDAVNEYLDWSGLSSTTDTAAPLNYGPNNTGFCNYQPPGGASGPFAGSYTGNQNQVCYAPCTDLVTDCSPDYPTLSQFEQWGLYDATEAESSDPDYYSTMVGTAMSMGIGLATALGSLALPFGTAIDASALSGSAIQQALFPFAGRAMQLAAAAARQGLSTADLATDLAPEISAGAETAGALSFVVGIAIFAIVTIVLASIQLATDLELPGQLQAALTAAQDTEPDLTSMNSSSSGYTALYSLFISTTLPEADLSCTSDNLAVSIGTQLCANAPTPPAWNSSDPSFLVSANGQTTLSNTIYSVDPTGIVNNNTYMSGNGWFVTQRFDPADPANATTPTDGGATLQSLSFPYTDWAGNNYMAERVMNNGQPMFAITPLDSSNENVCAIPTGGSTTPCLTNSIQFQEPNGSGTPIDATAQLVPASAAAPTAYASFPATVPAGQTATFTATGSDPNNLPMTYSWQFPAQFVDGSLVCPGSGPCDTTETGQSTTFTFNAPGIFPSTLTVTNSAGYSSTENFSVTVTDSTTTGVTTSVNPSTYGQQVTATADVQPTTLAGNPPGGTVPGFVQFLADGSPVGQPVELQSGSSTSCSCFEGTATVTLPALTPTPAGGSGHAITAEYLGTPDYFASTASLQNGQVVNLASTTLSMTESSAAPVVGQPVTITASVAPTDSDLALPTGTVDFYYLGVEVGSASLDSTGTATFPFTPTQVAPVSFTGSTLAAAYVSNGNFGASSAGSDWTAVPDGTVTNVTSSPASPTGYRVPVTFTANVAAAAPGGGTPTGDVQFSIDSTPIGSPVALDSNGNASLTTDASDVLAITGSGTSFLSGHAITAQYEGSADYTSSNDTVTQDVQPDDLTITASSPTVTYGGAVPSISPAYAGFVAGDTAASLTTAASCTTTYQAGNGVGSYPATCQGAVDGNYVIGYVSGSVQVQPAPLTVTANNESMLAGGSVPRLGFSVSGFVGSDGLSSLTAQPTCTAIDPATNGPVSAATAAGTYPITCSGGSAKNYALSYVAGTLTISANPTALVYSGGQTVVLGNSFSAAAIVSIPTASAASLADVCASGQPVSFSLNANPLTGATGPYAIGSASTSGGSASTSVSTAGWLPGVYTLTATSGANVTCMGATTTATVTVGSTGTSGSASGWYDLAGQGQVTFALTAATSGATTTGQISVSTGQWEFTGTLNSYVMTGGAGSATGSGQLSVWNPSLKNGKGGWQVVQSNATITASFTASVTGPNKVPGTFGVNIAYLPTMTQPSLPNSAALPIGGGNIKVS